ncbi:DUF4189 domain-containing protein [Luteimonas sp. SX5]|uniref:DUF4189 domain-containing protein n=1 Tax=Luteimonas galliterrae TaxID=2940486 RepID=A0ABT0MJT6_9GAMM|nr:DUF4189 domain-containing protein [Luteimonas galliterrae]MCL1635118.1 DUF4189 domain-containing protein [Luteimonas galliterrae]
MPRKWGSIAVDPAKQVAGFSKGMETDRRAEKAAIKDCKFRGGKSCKLETTYSNQCVGMVVGKNSIFRTARAETEGKALHFAMTICEYESGVKCQIYYAGCSFADRVN